MLKFFLTYFVEDAVPQTEFDSLHDVFNGVMDDADLDDENSFDKLFSQMRLMKGVYVNNHAPPL